MSSVTTSATASPRNAPLFALCDGRLALLHLGFCHAMLDVLNKHFQNILHVEQGAVGLIQTSVFGGVLPRWRLPSAMLIRRIGYQNGILLGLAVVAVGAFSFIPASLVVQDLRLVPVRAVRASSGLACIETAANPYVTVLGPKEGAAGRLSVAQAFNSVAYIIAPTVGGALIFGRRHAAGEVDFRSLLIPYLVLGCVVLVVIAVFSRVRLPEIEAEGPERARGRGGRPRGAAREATALRLGHRDAVPLHRRPGRGERLRRELHPLERDHEGRARDDRHRPALRLVPLGHRRGHPGSDGRLRGHDRDGAVRGRPIQRRGDHEARPAEPAALPVRRGQLPDHPGGDGGREERVLGGPAVLLAVHVDHVPVHLRDEPAQPGRADEARGFVPDHVDRGWRHRAAADGLARRSVPQHGAVLRHPAARVHRADLVRPGVPAPAAPVRGCGLSRRAGRPRPLFTVLG